MHPSLEKNMWLAAGITSAALSFLLAGLSMAGPPMIAPFALMMPSLPILTAGFIQNKKTATYAAIAATAGIIMTMPGEAALIICLMAIIPAAFVVKWLESPATTLPSLTTRLAIIFATATSLLAIIFWNENYSAYNGLEGFMRSQATEEIKNIPTTDMPPELLERLNNFVEMTFFIPAACGWIWAFIIILYVVMSKKMALTLKPQSFRQISAGNGSHPTDLLILMAISGVAIAIGSPQAAYLGKILFIIFLLPYFIIGMVRLHFGTVAWNGRGFLLFAIYLAMAISVWPMLMLSISEVARQCMRLMSSLPEKTDSA